MAPLISNTLSLQLQIAINHLEELEKLDMVFLLYYAQSIPSDGSYGSPRAYATFMLGP
jgi:hypothetical protein